METQITTIGTDKTAPQLAVLKDKINTIAQVMVEIMQPETDYGIIPGTSKPCLYKSGAEALCQLFRLRPEFITSTQYDAAGHLDVLTKCVLRAVKTGEIWGEGSAICTTRESKYAYRNKSRTCPECGAEAIIKGKTEYGGGWVCFKKKGGCGAKYADEFAGIVDQPTGQVANDNLPDVYNTVLKIAEKRAYVAATLFATGASRIFTQDIEDTIKNGNTPPPEPTAKPTTQPKKETKKPNYSNVSGPDDYGEMPF